MNPPTTTEAPRHRRKYDWSSSSGQLHPVEVFWRTHQPWLAQLGFTVRPRYMPDWKASWLGTNTKWPMDYEDANLLRRANILDARRSDGKEVALKQCCPSVHPYEGSIGQFLSSPELTKDPRNHSIPIYDVLPSPHEPDMNIIVMPLLRPFDDPPFDTIGEVVDFITQVAEGMQFLHEHHIAHRDNNGSNIMMDPTSLYPNGYHPVRIDRNRNFKGKAFHYTRTQRPPRYHLVDFGISRRYSPEQLPVQEDIILGGDKSPPEHEDENVITVDPFPTDVYFMGNMIRENFIQPFSGFDFVEPLVNDMTQFDPKKRPTMDEVVSRFANIRASLNVWTLRSRIAPRGEFFVATVWRAVPHWKRRIGYILRGIPAIPTGA